LHQLIPEEITTGEVLVYRSQSAPTEEIDPVVTLERICNWLGSILRKPDLARKLAGAISNALSLFIEKSVQVVLGVELKRAC
jgi:hypothetical protein